MIVRLVSLNIWDLPISLPGNQRKRRLSHLLDGLPAIDADIVLFQEAFRPDFKSRLATALPGFHADALAPQRRRSYWIELDGSGGLLTLSHWPITTSVFRASRTTPGMRLDERIGRKGCLWTAITTPAGPIVVGNVHLYAGNAPRDARVRAVQVRQILNAPQLRMPGPIVLAGDFNMAVEFERRTGGRTGFDLLAAAGFHEIAGGKTGTLFTMSPRHNRYAGRIQRFRHDRRLTQVFFRGMRPGPESPRLCFLDPPVSDHYGLRVALAHQ